MATKGHNVYFGGNGGCGKTHVAKCIINMLQERGVKYECTCTTGISCTLYEECSAAQTIHSFAGIGLCRGPKEEILRNILSHKDCVRRLRETDVSLIDEISMLSKRTFEIIQYVSQNVRNSDLAFGGIQVLAFGDFLQLPPIANSSDSGNYAFQSVMWTKTFPHQIILNENFRVDDDQNLTNLVKDLSIGNYSDENMQLLKSLNRPLNPADFELQYVPKLFPLNDDAEFENACMLDELPRNSVIFESYDIGNRQVVNRNLIAAEKLSLKVGAPVMFIYNISERIKNGVLGTVSSFVNGLPVVTTGSESVIVNKVAWSVYDNRDCSSVIGTRTQIPLKLAWAMTIHKSQGQTLPAVEVHCNRLFSPGHLYVAISRVKSSDRLRVVGFDEHKHLIPPTKAVLNDIDGINNVTVDDNCMCCNNKMPIPDDDAADITFESHTDDELSDGEMSDIDEAVRSYVMSSSSVELTSTLNVGTESDTLNLADLMKKLSSSANFHKIPDQFDYSGFVSSLKTAEHSEFDGSSSSEVNLVYDYLVSRDVIECTKLFLSIQWNRIFELIKKNVADNVNSVVKRKQFTCHFGELHSFLLSKQLETYFAEVVGLPLSQLSEKHFHALTELIFNLNKKILNLLASERLSSQDKEIEEKDSVARMNDCGKGKVRYCGAWAVGKISRSCKKYFKSNIYSSNDEVRIKAKEEYIKAELLHVTVNMV